MRGSSVDVSGERFFELVERSDPATLMAVARGKIEQLLVVYGQQGPTAARLQRPRHLRFTSRRRVPAPAKHEPLVRHPFAIAPADLIILLVGEKADAKAPADL